MGLRWRRWWRALLLAAGLVEKIKRYTRTPRQLEERMSAIETSGREAERMLRERIAVLENIYKNIQVRLDQFGTLNELGVRDDSSPEEDLAYLVVFVDELDRRLRRFADTLNRVRERTSHLRNRIETTEALVPKVPPHQRQGPWSRKRSRRFSTTRLD